MTHHARPCFGVVTDPCCMCVCVFVRSFYPRKARLTLASSLNTKTSMGFQDVPCYLLLLLLAEGPTSMVLPLHPLAAPFNPPCVRPVARADRSRMCYNSTSIFCLPFSSQGSSLKGFKNPKKKYGSPYVYFFFSLFFCAVRYIIFYIWKFFY